MIGIYSTSPPPPYPLPPFSPCLISLMVSVDVKHSVDLLSNRLTALLSLTVVIGYCLGRLQVHLVSGTTRFIALFGTARLAVLSEMTDKTGGSCHTAWL